MSVSSSFWLSNPPGSSSSRVRQWILYVVVATMLKMVFSKALPFKDLCVEDQANFAHQMHTIGSVDGRLWAITKDNWTVYELMPCQQNFNHSCMIVSSPMAIDTKWPKLAESAMAAAGAKDFDFKVNNSVIMNSHCFEHTVLAMDGSFITETHYFGFEFGTNKSFNTDNIDETQDPGLWISSNVQSKAYRLFDSGKQVNQIDFHNLPYFDICAIGENPDSKMNICDVTHQEGGSLEVQFTNSTCNRNMSWTIFKGVHHRDQFYFFSPENVYIFSDKAQTSPASVETLSYGDFFHCHKPTTFVPTSPRNVTSPSTNTTFDATIDFTKGQIWTIVILFCVILVSLMIICGIKVYECQVIRNQMSTSTKNGGKSANGGVLSGKDQQQQAKAVGSKANASGKAKSSIDGSKVSVGKVSSVEKPKSQAFKAKSAV